MEGGGVYIPAKGIPQHGAQTFLQLPGRLVCEGDGQHIPGACRAHRKVGGFPRQVAAAGHGAAQLVKVGLGHRAGQFPAAMGRAEPDDVGNAVDQHGGLAGARACQNEQRPLGSKDGLTLHRVEPGKPGFDILVAQGKIFSGNIGHNNDLSLVIYIIR